MLLLHQAGSVKIGEVVRYTVTYTPSADRILPSPEFLFLRIKNTSAIALRAAFVHGPYTLSVAAYPSTFNPNQKFENPRRYGVPEFEPMLKAGGTWNCHLVVPDNIRQSAGEGSSRHGNFGGGPEHAAESVSWVIEVTSQVIFSTSAAVHYEVLLARDEKSLNLGSVVPVIGGQAQIPQPGRVSDFQQSIGAVKDHPAQSKGVFSKAVCLKVEDTAALWNTPQLPGWDQDVRHNRHHGADAPVDAVIPDRRSHESNHPNKQKKVHLVVLTHGLHSNLGADMLFIKESIDAGVKQAKIDARARRAKERAAKTKPHETSEAEPTADATQDNKLPHDTASAMGQKTEEMDDEEEDEDEEVVVRGYSGNATKTERGIKYLGKRLARYVLSMTFPDQPFLPTSKAASAAIVQSLRVSNKEDKDTTGHGNGHHGRSSTESTRGYKITKISFIAHSLGGLVQTYAIAYIQKHSPRFFDLVEPVNFISLASPFLGLNHENPLYVKFALDFGLVGRTGQDLGLTWRAPTLARSGWGAIVGNLGENAQRRVYGEPQPESKPLLRILPTGPAHTALKKFRNRTVYSNVVNDGIVPLRTSCLLFLDWQGLGRVEKARREAGLVETVMGFGWAELTGANVTTPRLSPWAPLENQVEDSPGSATGDSTPTAVGNVHEVPQPPTNVMLEDDQQSLGAVASPFHEGGSPDLQDLKKSSTTNNGNPFSGFLNLFRHNEAPKTPSTPSPKQTRIYRRSQTLKSEDFSPSDSAASSSSKVTSGPEPADGFDGLSAPPKTTVFEAAGDLLNPKLPSVEYLIDPSKRTRTIFHDRIYHPSDIPPPPLKRRSTGSNTLNLLRKSNSRSFGSNSTQTTAGSDNSSPFPTPTIQKEDSTASQQDYDDALNTNPEMDPADMIDSSQMKVEEKIARAYHRGLSWRKVLVKLEPDAHNNVIVRRMFANAHGWPVVHHLVESHFSDSANARIRDADQANTEQAKHPSDPPDETGDETRPVKQGKVIAGDGPSDTKGQDDSEARDVLHDLPRSSSSTRPGYDGDNPLGVMYSSPGSSPRLRLDRRDSVTWSDRDWMESGEESDDSAFGEPLGSRRHSLDLNKKKADQKTAEAQSLTPSSSPTTWNWAEKIVGRGAARRRSKSPKSPPAPGAVGHGVVGESSLAKSLISPPTPTTSSGPTDGGRVDHSPERPPAEPDVHIRMPTSPTS